MSAHSCRFAELARSGERGRDATRHSPSAWPFGQLRCTNRQSCRFVELARSGGEGEIRTRGWIAPTPVFKTGALNHSATSPIFLLANVIALRRRDWGHPAF